MRAGVGAKDLVAPERWLRMAVRESPRSPFRTTYAPNPGIANILTASREDGVLPMEDNNLTTEYITKLLQESHQRQLAAQYRDFRQMEALLSLHSVFDFRSVLPPTRLWSVSTY